MTGSMRVTFWGVRGSIPSPGPETSVFGGNTPCLSVRTADAEVVLDAGSGIRKYGQMLFQEKGSTGHDIRLLITHTHWDHIQGLPFFAPLFGKANRITVAGPRTYNPGLARVIQGQTQHSYFPLRMGLMGAELNFRDLALGEYDDLVPGATVRTCVTNHPVVDLGYRIEAGGKTMVYLSDHECWSDKYAAFVRRAGDERAFSIEELLRGDLNDGVRSFIQGADLLVADAAYTDDEYAVRLGWGHSAFEEVWKLVAYSGVKRLAFFHHDPNRCDDELMKIEREFQAKNRDDKFVDEVFAAREGCVIEL